MYNKMFLSGEIINITSDLTKYIATNKNTKNAKHTNNSNNIYLISNIVDKSQITITISTDSDIYYSSNSAQDNSTQDNNEVLTIIILNKINKKRKQDKRDKNILEDEKTITIHYGNCSKYVLLNLQKIQSLLSKKVKKNNLQNVYQFENKIASDILYKFNDSIFIALDANGYINYYTDSMEIYNIHTIVNFITQEHPNSNKTYLPTLESILEAFNYIPIDANMNSNAYILDSLDINNLHNATPSTTSPTNTFEVSNSNITSELNTSGIISTIGNIINWFNPFSYFTTIKPITIQNTNANANIDIDTNIEANIEANTEESNQEEVTAKAKAKYYVASNSSTSSNAMVIKLENDKIKILRPKPMLFPVYIDNINLDELGNIIFSGKINDTDKYITIKYNKFLINPIIEITNIETTLTIKDILE